jgi:hypothetical protein
MNVCLNALTALLDWGHGHDGPEWTGRPIHEGFPNGEITSSAWAGWWCPETEPH